MSMVRFRRAEGRQRDVTAAEPGISVRNIPDGMGWRKASQARGAYSWLPPRSVRRPEGTTMLRTRWGVSPRPAQSVVHEASRPYRCRCPDGALALTWQRCGRSLTSRAHAVWTVSIRRPLPGVKPRADLVSVCAAKGHPFPGPHPEQRQESVEVGAACGGGSRPPAARQALTASACSLVVKESIRWPGAGQRLKYRAQSSIVGTRSGPL